MRGAHPERALERRVAQRAELRPDETVLVALSGGSDSAALAALIAKAARSAGARTVCGHVNHGIRPSAWHDEGVALALGAALGIPVAVAHPAPGAADENALRDVRYAALAALAEAYGATRVFTAHHAEDQTESVLLALFRGSGADGLLGMARVRPLGPGLSLERPLLEVPKAALTRYALASGLPVVIDPTNAETGYRRNALRASLSGLRAQFDHLDEAVARAAALLREEREGKPRADIRRSLRAALAAGGAGTRDLTFERLDAAARAIESMRQGRHFLRPGVEVLIGPARSTESESERKPANAEKHASA